MIIDQCFRCKLGKHIPRLLRYIKSNVRCGELDFFICKIIVKTANYGNISVWYCKSFFGAVIFLLLNGVYRYDFIKGNSHKR